MNRGSWGGAGGGVCVLAARWRDWVGGGREARGRREWIAQGGVERRVGRGLWRPSRALRA